MTANPNTLNGDTRATAKSSAKAKAGKTLDAAKTKAKDAEPKVDALVERAAATGERALQTARDQVEPLTAFVKKHRRVLTTVAIAAGVGAAALIALRRYPQAPRHARRMAGSLAKAAIASGVVEKAFDYAKDARRSAAKGISKLEKMRAPEIRLSPRQTRKLERQLAALKKAPRQVREALPF